MILSVCSDKGAPGVTTLATALSVVWPREKVLVEADPSGADLPFRLRHSTSGLWLNPDPSITSLAAVTRLGPPPSGIAAYTQPSTLGVPIIPGALTAERAAPLRAWWPQLSAAFAAWDGTVICDLGRLQPGHAALPVAASSAVVLLLARADLGGLFHLRERVVELAHAVGDPTREINPVTVVITGPPKTRAKSLAETAALLQSIGSPAQVVGFVPEDRQGTQDLWSGVVTRRLAGSPLIRSVQQLAEQLLRTRPELAPQPDVPQAASSRPENPAATTLSPPNPPPVEAGVSR